jgi:hypothetical protein
VVTAALSVVTDSFSNKKLKLELPAHDALHEYSDRIEEVEHDEDDNSLAGFLSDVGEVMEPAENVKLEDANEVKIKIEKD